ncbi:unnamed protein product [Staurois parvus]|uniref:Uncharacterized protein n=1 Tax=Staurois parvus TaxID=386267 RepID=A0ABN9EQ82_9NEOB|nr:unnamed protein product [Staurois parvus]
MTVMGMYRRGVRRYDSDGYVQERSMTGGICTVRGYVQERRRRSDGGMTVMGMYRRGVRRYDSDGYVQERSTGGMVWVCTGEEYGGMTVMGMYRSGVSPVILSRTHQRNMVGDRPECPS